MRMVSRRVLRMILSRGYVRSVRTDVRLVMVYVWGMPVRLMTIGRMSIIVPCEWLRRALAKGVYLSRIISCAV
jgi:hypothetical protein